MSVCETKWLLADKMAAFGACVSLLEVFQSFFGVPNHSSLHSSLSFSLDSGVDCAAQISNGRKTKEMGLLEFEGHSRFRGSSEERV